jgi:hypothetical protein
MQPPGPPRRCDSNQELSSKPGAIHTGTQFLVLSSVTNAAEIFYTTNGDVPTSASTKYTAPIKLMASQTIKAIAMKTGMATSAVDSASYTIKPGATSTGSLILGNQTYRTVKIDEQNWMAENLNFRGSGADTVGVCYRDSVGYCAKNGRLYTWAEVMNLPDSCSVVSCASQIKPKHQGICPTGWHVPTKAEWTSLTDFTGSEGISSLPHPVHAAHAAHAAGHAAALVLLRARRRSGLRWSAAGRRWRRRSGGRCGSPWRGR